MQTKQKRDRIKTQIAGLQRMMQILKAELFSSISDFASNQDHVEGEISNGITDLLVRGDAISPAVQSSYQTFAPRVWVSLGGGNEGAAYMVVAHQTAQIIDALEAGKNHVARLSINPVNIDQASPQWVNLETELDTNGLSCQDGIKLDVVCAFTFTSRESPRGTSSNVDVTLRYETIAGDKFDVRLGSIPVTTIPFQHTIIIEQPFKNIVEMSSISRATIMFELPKSGDYSFNIDYFCIKKLSS